jgi:hypothetical protein
MTSDHFCAFKKALRAAFGAKRPVVAGACVQGCLGSGRGADREGHSRPRGINSGLGDSCYRVANTRYALPRTAMLSFKKRDFGSRLCDLFKDHSTLGVFARSQASARCYRTLSVSSGPAVMNQRLKWLPGASRRKSHMKGAVTLVFGSAFLAISASPRT